MQNIPFHPIADIFPLVRGKEFAELKQDIQAHGVREPVVLLDGQILDGRNRFRACQEVGVEPEYIEFHGDDPLSYVISLNLHRRHLDESGRGLVADRIATMRQGERTDLSQNSERLSKQQAAELMNVHPNTVTKAHKVNTEGTENLQSAVMEGKASLHAAADISSLPRDEQDQIVAKGEKEILEKAKAIRAEKAQQKRAERVEKITTIAQGNKELSTDKKYPVIYCDPPWRYEHIETESRAIENQYPTMALDDICALPVSDIAHEDCVLFMWTTSPKLAESMQVIEAWGFDYRTCAIWDKQKKGMGYYFRQRHELLLVATKGSLPTPEPANRPDSIFTFPRAEHSAKPLEVAEMITAMYPEYDRIELFCRDPQEGWDAWGNQASA